MSNASDISSSDDNNYAHCYSLSPYNSNLLKISSAVNKNTNIHTITMDLTQEDDVDEMDIARDLPSTSAGVAIGPSRGRPGRPRRISVGSSEDRTVKKASTALEKEAKKQKLAQEKAAKKAAAEKNKIYKPGECMTYMTIEAHPSLCACWYMGDVSREAAAAGSRLVTSPALCHPALLVWTRTVPQTLDTLNGVVKLSPGIENCDRALYVATAEEVAEHVCEHTLASHLAQIRDMAGCKLTLVVFGVKDYLKSSRRKTSNSNKTTMTEIDMEMAITDLLVSTDCDTVIVNTPNELALLIVQFTKAIAEAPFKKAKRAYDEQAEFYMRGDSKKCVAVDKDGAGVGRLWQQMIAILPLSSLETSRALCAQYKSPVALYEALQSPDSVNTIADIGVARAAVPGSKVRRIGPEFARKLRTLFTAEDGDILVD